MNEELKPINNDDLKPISNDFSQELQVKEESKVTTEEDKFASKFPEWDLVPTNQVVRRVTRK